MRASSASDRVAQEETAPPVVDEDKGAAGGLEMLLSGKLDIDEAFATIQRGEGKKEKKSKKK